MSDEDDESLLWMTISGIIIRGWRSRIGTMMRSKLLLIGEKTEVIDVAKGSGVVPFK